MLIRELLIVVFPYLGLAGEAARARVREVAQALVALQSTGEQVDNTVAAASGGPAARA